MLYSFCSLVPDHTCVYEKTPPKIKSSALMPRRFLGVVLFGHSSAHPQAKPSQAKPSQAKPSQSSQLASWGISDMVLILPRGSVLFCLGRAQRIGHIKPCTYNRTQRTRYKEWATEKAAHSATAAIRWHALVWNPAVLRHGTALIEHIDGNSTTWVPIAADAQPLRAEKVDKPLAN